MRIIVFIQAFLVLSKGDSDHTDTDDGLSFSFSKTKSTSTGNDDHETSNVQESKNAITANSMTQSSDPRSTSESNDVRKGTVDSVDSHNELQPSADDSSVILEEITHQQNQFAIHMHGMAQRVSELGLEGLHAASMLRVLESYVEVLLKSLHQLGTLQDEERKYYSRVKETVHVCCILADRIYS